MFMDSIIAPINVYSISYELLTKHEDRNIKVSMFFFE